MNPLQRALLPLLLLTLAACASTMPAGKSTAASEEDAVMARAVERWNLLIGKDPKTAWTYLSPGYRSTHPQDIYAAEMGSRPVKWNKVEPYQREPDAEGVKGVQCDDTGDACEVRLRVHFKIRSHLASVGLVESATVVKENWIRLDGNWYLVPKDIVK